MIPAVLQLTYNKKAGKENRRSGPIEAVCGSVSLYALPHLLRFLDKNSMMFSIESRVPFLDHKLVEYLHSIPSEQLINNEVTKYAFRKAMEGEVPEKVFEKVISLPITFFYIHSGRPTQPQLLYSCA